MQYSSTHTARAPFPLLPIASPRGPSDFRTASVCGPAGTRAYIWPFTPSPHTTTYAVPVQAACTSPTA